MSHNKPHEYYKYDSERDDESINCCQLDVHKQLIRERNASVQANVPFDFHAKRSCTDIFCLFMFIPAVIAWIIISVIVLSDGALEKNLAATDSNNRLCGFDKGVEDRPYLFFFDITKCLGSRDNIFFCDAKQVCVSECPTTNFSVSHYLQNGSPLADIKEKLICVDEFSKEFQINSYEDVKNAIKAGYCTEWYLESEPVSRLCLPKSLPSKFHPYANARVNLPEGTQTELNGISYSLLKSAVYQVRRSDGILDEMGKAVAEFWGLIVGFMFVTVVFSFVFIIIMRWISGIVVWSVIFALIGFLVFSCVYTWTKFSDANDRMAVLSKTKVAAFSNLRNNLKSMRNDANGDKNLWLTLFIFSVLALVLISLIVLCVRNRIRLAIQLTKEGSKAVSHSWTSLFFPILPMILQGLILVLGVLTALCLFGERVPVFRVSGLNESQCTCHNGYKDNDICNIETFKSNCNDVYGNQCLTASCSFSTKESESITVYLHLYNLFMVFWCEFFIFGFSHMSLAMTFAMYYWTSKKSKLPSCLIGMSVLKVLRYHLGTIAFGSLLLGLLSWIRALVEFLYRSSNNINKPVFQLVKCLCGWILKFLHRLLRKFTKNAYIMCAMKGTNFCSSARHAFLLIITNIARASVLDGVTFFLFFVMKFIIAISTSVIAYFVFEEVAPHFNDSDEYNQIYHTASPIMVVFLSSFLITCLFFSVYSAAIDTIFLCALEDLEQNDGTPEKPFAMSKALIKIFKVKNRMRAVPVPGI